MSTIPSNSPWVVVAVRRDQLEELEELLASKDFDFKVIDSDVRHLVKTLQQMNREERTMREANGRILVAFGERLLDPDPEER